MTRTLYDSKYNLKLASPREPDLLCRFSYGATVYGRIFVKSFPVCQRFHQTTDGATISNLNTQYTSGINPNGEKYVYCALFSR